MEAKKCSSCTKRNSQSSYLHGNSLLQNGINILGKTEKSCQSSAKPTSQQQLRNTKSLESRKRQTGPSNKSLWDEPHSYQDTPKFPTIEQQLEHLIPSKELLLHYRGKIVQLNDDYEALMERVDQ
jgi:hypothetical protein